MLVPVCVDAAANEWSVVEFQGQLVSEELRGAEIGALRFADGVPTLRVGNHVLEGKVVKLAKPFAVLHKEPASDSSAGPDGGEAAVRYEVVGVARTRLIFGSRPQPVLN